MKLYRIIDKQTKLFIRDDFTFDEETEIGLDVEASQGLYKPKWDGEKWVEGATEIPTPTPQAPTIEERVQLLEEVVLGGNHEIQSR